MAKILFAWEMGEGMGHLVPLRPVLEAVVGKGHQLVVAAVDLRSARSALGHIASAFLQAPKVVERSFRLGRHAEGVADLLAMNGFCDPSMLRGRHHVWRQIADIHKPDLVLAEHAPGALLMARSLGIAAVHAGTGFTLPPENSPILFPGFEPGENAEREVRVVERFNELVAQGGGRPLQSLGQLYNDVEGRFLLTFRELDQLGPREGVPYLGADVPASGDVPQWVGSGKRVFAYLKPRADIEAFFKAVQKLGLSMVMVADRIDPALTDRYNAGNIRIVKQRFNMKAVVEQADLLVFNGNHGTACAGLTGGVPMLAFPLHQEQESCTRRVIDSGLGSGLFQPQGKAMESTLAALLEDGQVSARSREVAASYASYRYEDSVAHMVSQLESLL